MNIESYSDKDLLKFITSDRLNYRHTVTIVALEELMRRGLIDMETHDQVIKEDLELSYLCKRKNRSRSRFIIALVSLFVGMLLFRFYKPFAVVFIVALIVGINAGLNLIMIKVGPREMNYFN